MAPITAAPTNRLDSVMTTVGIARLFRVSRVTVNNWRRRGCPVVMIPGDRRDFPRYVLYDVVEWRKRLRLPVPPWVTGQLTRALSAVPPGPATPRRGSRRSGR